MATQKKGRRLRREFRGMAARTKERLGIQSVEVAARILRALAHSGRSLPLRDLAKAAGMHPGKAHRYLVSLTRVELVVQDEMSGHYGIGAAAIELGLVGLHGIDVARTATSMLPGLRDEINETVLLAMWTARGPVVFALEESSRPVFMNIRVGSILPLLTTATGKLFTAFLPKQMTADLVESEMKNAPTRARDSFDKAIEEARRHGLARVAGDLVPGVNAMAAPLFDHKDQIVGVIGALGRSEELNINYRGPIGAALLRTANEISRRLGRRAASDQPFAMLDRPDHKISHA
jgi:DNA-binding IclR family transcriptional regulator